MRINFNGYSYIGDDKPNTTEQGYDFNPSEYDKLRANRQYLDAANYLKNYHFDDPRLQQEHENNILNLEREGRKVSGMFKNMLADDKESNYAINFATNVFTGGGLDLVETGQYGKDFRNAKESIGSAKRNTIDVMNPEYISNLNVKQKGAVVAKRLVESGALPGGLNPAINAMYHITGLLGDGVAGDNAKDIAPKDTADKLAITFSPKGSTIFGNEWDINYFYDKIGLGAEDLKNNGIEITHKDGKTTLKFHKSNNLANKILYNLPNKLDENIILPDFNDFPLIEGYSSDGKLLSSMTSNKDASLVKLKRLVDKANGVRDSFLINSSETTKDYSTVVCPFISDELMQLQEQNLTDDEYSKRAKLVAPKIYSAIRSMSSSSYRMYSDINNKNLTDETLMPMDNKDRALIVNNLFSSTPDKNMQIDAMICNGEVGALITINAIGEDSKNISEDNKTGAKRSRIQVFVPGLLTEECQARINKDTNSRAIQEINSMMDYNYDYDLFTGGTISRNINGQFTKDNTVITKSEAIKEINKSMMLQSANHYMKFKYMNKDGNFTDDQLSYFSDCKNFACKAIQELYPELKVGADTTTGEIIVTDKYGNSYLGTDLVNRSVNYNTLQFESYHQFKELADIYDELISTWNVPFNYANKY